jgi:hypothetical protein
LKEKNYSILFYSILFYSILRRSVAEFVDPEGGDKVNSGIELSYRPAGYMGWGSGEPGQLYARVDFISQSWIYEFGYRLCCFLLAYIGKAFTYPNNI